MMAAIMLSAIIEALPGKIKTADLIEVVNMTDWKYNGPYDMTLYKIIPCRVPLI
jgi:hypothetical protein